MRTLTLTLLLLASLIGGTFAAGLFAPAGTVLGTALETSTDDEYDPCSDDPAADCARIRIPVG